MRRSFALLVAAFAAAPTLASADSMDAEAARSFVVGRTFSYSCYEGTVGSGRVLADGSVAGTIRVRGQGSARYVELPAGTLKAKGASICAQLRGVAFQPCFELDKISDTSFRGNIAGFDRMWCEFNRGGSGRSALVTRRKTGATAEVQARN
ncbi:hypothetical protein [Ancylobacter terrae]|uniref:hypothetical protein n=1 Tax=Ancylobacter sp. sgz301288 TaxID=3342077 RepID=UPI00385A6BC4